ncbi:MAG: pyridoxal-phosphate dependent enzyme, partial [Myxococcales bacterium]|nr:pyridoxal-phosphate dependent enzyme [Myxococcales bacterium]
AEVWIKRDDQSAPIYGGGKVRKLEYVLANPPHDDGRPIVSVGGIGSHHLVALALYLQPMGRALHAWTFDQVVTPHVRRNLATLVACGAQLWDVKTRPGLAWAALRYYAHQLLRLRRPARFLTAGASTGLGSLGFVVAGLELGEQIERGALPRPRRIYITGGSAGSAGGLALGLALARVPTHLRIVSAVEPVLFNARALRSMLRAGYRALRAAGLPPRRGGARGLLGGAGVTWSIDPTQVGPGYATPTAAAAEAVAAAREHDLSLETTYTGKCAAALRADLEAGALDGPILLWNTHASTDLTPYVAPGWQQRLSPRLQAVLERAALERPDS